MDLIPFGIISLEINDFNLHRFGGTLSARVRAIQKIINTTLDYSFFAETFPFLLDFSLFLFYSQLLVDTKRICTRTLDFDVDTHAARSHISICTNKHTRY